MENSPKTLLKVYFALQTFQVCSLILPIQQQKNSIDCKIFTIVYATQFVIFNPWKVSWNWIAFSQNSFVISPGLLYHLIRCNTGWLANKAFTLNPIVQKLQTELKFSMVKGENSSFVITLMHKQLLVCLKLEKNSPFPKASNKQFYRYIYSFAFLYILYLPGSLLSWWY